MIHWRDNRLGVRMVLIILMAQMISCAKQDARQEPRIKSNKGVPWVFQPSFSLNLGRPVFIEQWMGVYLHDQKIGLTSIILEPIEPSDPLYQDGYRFRFHETMNVHGVQSETEAELREDFSLGKFRFHFPGDQGESGMMSCSGEVVGENLVVRVESAGTEVQKVFPLSEPVFSSSAAHFGAIRQGLTPGLTATCLVFDPISQSLAPFKLEVLDRAPKTVQQQTWEAATVKVTFQDIEQISWITDSGLRLRDEALGGAMVAWMESEEEAAHTAKEFELKGDIGEFMTSLIDRFKAPVEGSIRSPRDCRKLVLEVRGIRPEDIVVDDYWQRLVQGSEGEGFRVEISHRPRPVPSFEAEEYLDSGFLVQTDAPAIVSKAKELVGNLASDREKAVELCRWVYENMDRSSLRMTIPSAVEVLQTLKGDCNEHSTLYAALARAAGIPTKICAGVMYSQEAFYYHAWNEVYIEDTGWIPLDATLNQFPADATHLKLVEGELDQQVGVLKAVGNLHLKVIEEDSASGR